LQEVYTAHCLEAMILLVLVRYVSCESTWLMSKTIMLKKNIALRYFHIDSCRCTSFQVYYNHQTSQNLWQFSGTNLGTEYGTNANVEHLYIIQVICLKSSAL